MEIRMSGFGGQGIILMGKVLGSAAALHHGHHVTLIQSYGPETRGSSCRVDLILDRHPINYPYLDRPHLLVALSQAAYQQHRPSLVSGGMLIYEEDLVVLGENDQNGNAGLESVIRHPIPAVSLAEECGGRIMANMIVLGYIAANNEWVGMDALAQTIKDKMPSALASKNLLALQRGYEYGLEYLTREEELKFEHMAQVASAQ
ncbi:2-oxoacid:acceptor oxidoreductase family protein [bacterium]|nr:2-oxoacid:acceptor oxidoreductase family protein [bacterium]